MGVKQAIKNLDAFPRAEEHLLQKTQSGALVSIVGLVIMATLFFHELTYYLSTYTVHQMSVDLKRGETLPIHINMTFPSLPCDVLSVDAIDMSGKHEVDLDTNIWKLRLNSHGHIIGTEYLSDLVEKEHAAHKHDDENEHHDDADKKLHALGFNEEAENMIKKVKKALDNGEGCRVYGVLDVQRVAGNFHISVHGLNIYVAQMGFGLVIEVYGNLGLLECLRMAKFGVDAWADFLDLGSLKLWMKFGKSVVASYGSWCWILGMLVISGLKEGRIFGGATHVNVSHMIHDLSFGPKYPGLHNPLDGTVRILHETSGTFKNELLYLDISVHPSDVFTTLQIVPTEYRYIWKEVLPTNQFSVSEYFSPMKEYDRSWPAVYFLYDLSPITVTIKEERRSFLHFITRLCAVLGGTFALTGMLDRWMYRLIEEVTKASGTRAYR
ncbi:hypothetical protein Godav_029279 [Gossypium davidsonii]|uniref:Endoplasmic reticulum vesicle transporter C-terminal domain-containing protein n=1 Tax=Gossypium davidsonii TaxID=34287 RepID=A0A7J8TGU6_GOSDV|nr:hypothetical protein [Gossypium davidsonii]